MKKKIRDITLVKIRRICEIQTLCNECPLYKKDEEREEDGICSLDVPDFIPDWFLDLEVEIPEEPVEISDKLEEEDEKTD